MDFKISTGLERVLEKLGVNSLQDAITKEREKIKGGEAPFVLKRDSDLYKQLSAGFEPGFKALAKSIEDEIKCNPDETQDKYKYAPPYSKPRLPYSDPD